VLARTRELVPDDRISSNVHDPGALRRSAAPSAERWAGRIIGRSSHARRGLVRTSPDRSLRCVVVVEVVDSPGLDFLMALQRWHHRPVPTGDEATLKHLGNVLVTIDDLAALLEICQRHADEAASAGSAPGRRPGPRQSPVPVGRWQSERMLTHVTRDSAGRRMARLPASQVEVFFSMERFRFRDFLSNGFPGNDEVGYASSFTQASDMAKLSDEELKWLRVQSPQVRVILGKRCAYAAGDEDIVQLIDKAWAKERQIARIRPYHLGIVLVMVAFFAAVVFGIFWVAVVAAYSLFGASTSSLGNLTISLPGFAAAVSLVFFGLRTWQFSGEGLFSSAAVVPSGLNEYRKGAAANKYPRLSWIVAVIAAIIAAIALIPKETIADVLGNLFR
jgi:hypothetical protein